MAKGKLIDKIIKISKTLSSANLDMHIFYYFLNDERKRFTPKAVLNYTGEDLFLICEIMPFAKNRKDFLDGKKSGEGNYINSDINIQTISSMKGLNLTLGLGEINQVKYIKDEGYIEFYIGMDVTRLRLRIYKDGFVNITDMAIKPITIDQILNGNL